MCIRDSYGPKQHPEKLIPKLIYNLINNHPLPIYDKGKNSREWIYVDDHCEALIKIYKKVRKKEGMGLGDAKLLAVVGFWFGWFSIPFTIFMSSVVALIFVLPSLINKSRKMSSQIPFGPYIIIAAIFYVSFSSQIKSFLL